MTTFSKILKIIFLCVAMFYCTAMSFSQSDSSMYVTLGGAFEDGFNAVLFDTDSNLVFGGYTSSQNGNGTKGYLVKMDSLMNLLWSVTYSEYSDASFEDIVPNGEGYLAVGKLLNPSTSYDILLAQFSEEGELVWDKHLGGDDWDFGNSISPISGGFLITGETYSYSENADAYAAKIDENGTVLWEKTFSSEFNELFNDGRESGNELLMFGGEKKLDNENSEQWFVLTDNEGEVILERSYGTEGTNILHAVLADPIDETYFILGEIYNTNTESTNATMARLDDMGEVMWLDTIASSGTTKWLNAEIGRSNELVCTGSILDAGFGNQGNDFFIKRITRTNTYVNQTTFGTNNDDYPEHFIRIANAYIAVGRTDGLGQGQFDAFIIRTRNSGSDENFSTTENLDTTADFFQRIEENTAPDSDFYYSDITNELYFPADTRTYSIYNLLGSKVQGSTVNTRKISLNLKPGVYLVQVNDSKISNKKILLR